MRWAGNFQHIREKMEALASGDWARRSVAKPVGDEPGRFKVRVFQAWYGKNGRILWQVDVGFDENYGRNCQIVRGLGTPISAAGRVVS